MNNKARVLLINPWIYDFAAFDFWAKPLGLLYIAESLRRKGIEVALLDCLEITKEKKFGMAHFLKEKISKPEVLKGIPRKFSRYGVPEKVFMQNLKSFPLPDAALVTSIMTYWYPGVFRVIELIRRHSPQTPVILGGIYATLCWEHAQKFSGADHIYRGKTEKDFFQLLSRYISINVPEQENPVMDCRPAIDLVKNPRYGVLVTSEGCPFSCHYCASKILSPCFEQKPWETCFKEILWMSQTLGLKDIAFYDDALLTRAKLHFIPLMEKIYQSGLNIRFHIPNGINIREITPEIALYLKRAGFKTVRLGMETIKSGKERLIDNKASYGELGEAISALKRAGFAASEIGVYLLCGLPGQTREEVEEALRKVKEAGARPYLSEFSPIPGTEIWEEAKRASPYPIEEDPLFQNPSLSPCAPEGFTLERFQWRRSIWRGQAIK